MTFIWELLYNITWWGWVSTLIFTSFQLFFVYKTWLKLNFVSSVFPKNARFQKNEEPNINSITCVDNSGKKLENKSLTLLINELNDYIRKNVGTADFSIIQHKTDRYVDSMFEDAISRISFPTYLGLMGTFFGVLVGLSCFNVSDGADLVTDAKVSNLINGVLVSMFTSFAGLIMTTVSNHKAASVKKDLDDSKNSFYEFIQNELMPELGTSMVSALAKLRSTINRFEPSFNKVIDRFQDTFEHCTNSFGSAFRDNVLVVSDAVKVMGENMGTINKAVENQKELLSVLKSSALNKTLDKFVSTTDRFESLADSMSLLYQVKEEIIIATRELIFTQKEYNESLTVPQLVAERMNAILDRINNFEQSINGLGESIAQTQLIGNREMNLIEKQLEIIQTKNNLAVNYADTANEKLEELFNTQIGTIKELNNRYKSTITNHADELERMVDEMTTELNKKWITFANTLEESFDIKAVQTDFEHLKRLQTIDTKLVDIERIVNDKSALKDGLSALKDILLSMPIAKANSNSHNSTTATVATTTMPQIILPSNSNSIEQKVDTIYSKVNSISSIESQLRELKYSIESIQIPVATSSITGISEDKKELQSLLNIERDRVLSLKRELDSLKSTLNDGNQKTTKIISNLEGLNIQLKEKDTKINELQEELDKAKQNFLSRIFNRK